MNLKSRPRFLFKLGARMLVVGFVVFTFLPAMNLVQAVAQGFTVESKSIPSVVGAGTFVSLQGGFSLALPQNVHGFRRVSIPTPSGPGAGDSYQWNMKEGSFTAAYAEAAEPLDDPETSKRIFARMHDSVEGFASSHNGKVVSEKPIELDKHAGVELRFEFPNEFMIQRIYLVSHRMYQVVVGLKNEQRVYEALAISVLDSLKILNEAEVATVVKEQAARAEPSPLPQEPVAPRIASDAADRGLLGKVKTVFTESQDLSGTWSVQTRKPNSMDFYNERGNLTKAEFYDYQGNLSDISVYGYLDGTRASKQESIRHEYDPPPMMLELPPGKEKPKYDPRYSYKFAFRYDEKKRLTEETRIGNDGKLWLRYVYKYSGNQREELVYSADGALNQRYLSTLDDKGNQVEETIYEAGAGSIRSKHSYVYEFDAQGNWTKRTGSKWVTKDGRSYYEPEAIYYQTTTYY